MLLIVNSVIWMKTVCYVWIVLCVFRRWWDSHHLDANEEFTRERNFLLSSTLSINPSFTFCIDFKVQMKWPRGLCVFVCLCAEYTRCHSDETEGVEGQISKRLGDAFCLLSNSSDISLKPLQRICLFCTSGGCPQGDCIAQMLLFQNSGDLIEFLAAFQLSTWSQMFFT